MISGCWRVMTRRRQQGVESYPKGMFDRTRYYFLKQRTVDFKAGVGVTLYEVHFKLAADVKVKAV
jgi:hypothetical protein